MGKIPQKMGRLSPLPVTSALGARPLPEAAWARPAGGKARGNDGRRRQSLLRGPQLGYRGKGPPDLDTLLALQDSYAGGLPPAILPRYKRLRELLAKSPDDDKKAETFAEAAALSREIMPILHFKEDEVDWDN